MKSKLLVLALSMFCVSFLAANGTVDANNGKVLASAAAVEVKTDAPAVDADQKEVAAEEVAEIEAEKAKKAQESSCKSCK